MNRVGRAYSTDTRHENCVLSELRIAYCGRLVLTAKQRYLRLLWLVTWFDVFSSSLLRCSQSWVRPIWIVGIFMLYTLVESGFVVTSLMHKKSSGRFFLPCFCWYVVWSVLLLVSGFHLVLGRALFLPMFKVITLWSLMIFCCLDLKKWFSVVSL